MEITLVTDGKYTMAASPIKIAAAHINIFFIQTAPLCALPG
jgi:hypothetical protein